MIIEGLLRVNGEVASIGQKIDPEADRVTVGAKAIPSPKQPELTYLVNKPKGYICSNRDPYNAKTVFDLLPMGLSMRNLFCAGRLDKESEGMAILTNNGSLVQRLTHPSKRVVKRYQVILDRPLSPSTASRLLKGIYDQGEYLKVEKVIPNRRGRESVCSVELHLSHGRKREIRRLMKAAGYKVKRLYRFQIGGLKLIGLGNGKCRPLSRREIDLLTERV